MYLNKVKYTIKIHRNRIELFSLTSGRLHSQRSNLQFLQTTQSAVVVIKNFNSAFTVLQ